MISLRPPKRWRIHPPERPSVTVDGRPVRAELLDGLIPTSVIRDRIKQYVRTSPYGDYQVRGVRFFTNHDGRVLNADDMGLGKSWQTIAYAATQPKIRPIVVVCPATVKFNWQREWRMHAGLRSFVCDGNITTDEQDLKARHKALERYEKKYGRKPWEVTRRMRDFRALQQSNRAEQVQKIRDMHRFDIIIINYEIVESWLPALLSLNAQLFVLDECHYIKNQKARRTKACRALTAGAQHVIGLSGTPISGRPAEFWPILNIIFPKQFPSFWKYAFEFCAPKRNRFSGGWDFSGSDHLDALRDRLKGKMIRRLKKDVLKDLPKKTRTFLPIDIDNRREYDKAEEDFLSWLLRTKGRDAWDRASRAQAIVRLNGLRQLAAMGKVNAAIAWIKDWLESTDQKLIVFGIHRNVLSAIKKEFPRATFVDGSVSGTPIKLENGDVTSQRQKMVDRFQNEPVTSNLKRRLQGDGLFIGQLRAAGVGINLTAGSNVLFIELGWNPGDHDQAEDRALRIGQKRQVSIYYLVGRRTIEQRMLEILQTKDETVSRILDGNKSGGMMKLMSLFERDIRRRVAA